MKIEIVCRLMIQIPENVSVVKLPDLVTEFGRKLKEGIEEEDGVTFEVLSYSAKHP